MACWTWTSRSSCFISRLQYHFSTTFTLSAAKWVAGHGQAVQVVRYEKVPAERQSRDEEAVSGEKQAGDTGEEF